MKLYFKRLQAFSYLEAFPSQMQVFSMICNERKDEGENCFSRMDFFK